MKECGWLGGLMICLLATRLTAGAQEIKRVMDISPVWSGHPVGFASLTGSNRQYLAFYDAERQMTVAMRRLPETNWTLVRLPEKVAWDSHNYIALVMDAAGHLHLSGNMHVRPLVYFRTEQPLEITTFKRIAAMTGQDEQRATYPIFHTGPGGELIFTYRNGSSGNGDQIYNVYDVATRTWRRLLDKPLLNGEGQRNAYLHGPVRGPDGWLHLCWIWRETPDCSTSHGICYARSRDWVHWETSAGKPLQLPMTFATCETIDPVPVHGGAINGNVVLGFDAQKRPIVSYHKFDTNGFTQVFNARLEGGQWTQHQATDWKFRWDFSGGGSIGFDVKVGAVSVNADRKLVQHLSSKQEGTATWLLDPGTLKPVKRVPVKGRLPASLSKPTISFPGMQVRWHPIPGSETRDSQCWLRWETLGPNRDRPRSDPLPPPSKLQVFEISNAAVPGAEAADDL
jgi:hypothetical protein